MGIYLDGSYKTLWIVEKHEFHLIPALLVQFDISLTMTDLDFSAVVSELFLFHDC